MTLSWRGRAFGYVSAPTYAVRETSTPPQVTRAIWCEGVSLDRRETVRALSPAQNLRPLRGCSPSTRAAVSLTCDGEGVYARRSHLWRRRAP